MGLLSGLFGGGNKTTVAPTTTSTSSTTNLADNRVVLGNDAVQNSGSYAVDSGNSWWSSSSTTNIGTDGGAVQIAKFNADLLSSVSQDQGDTVRLIAAMGADGVARQAEAATDLFATSSTAASAAWGHTLDASGELIDKLLQTAQGTVAGANAIASQAVASYTPTENKNADAIKYAAIAVAVFVAFKVLKG
jgi:hypothetical protein